MARELYVSLWVQAYEREWPVVRVVDWLRRGPGPPPRDPDRQASYQLHLSAVETFGLARRLAGELPKPCLEAILHEASVMLEGEPAADRDPVATLRIAARLHAQNHEFDRACGADEPAVPDGRLVIVGFLAG